MTLLQCIVKQVASHESLGRRGRFPSPPPSDTTMKFIGKIAKKKIRRYQHVLPKVDSKPPRYYRRYALSNLEGWALDYRKIYLENMRMLTLIRRYHLQGEGKVDSRWKVMPERTLVEYYQRCNFLKKVRAGNLLMYKYLMSATPKVQTTASLNREWARNRKRIVQQAYNKFVLFPPIPTDDIEDPAFKTPQGIKRPRVFITLRYPGSAIIGDLQVELFTDLCPNTCQLFLDLVDGDGLGHGYVGTHFFRKVPNLYWSGGDVIYNNGFGCYMQKGRTFPIGAENYHFSHTMPGLLSMRMTCDNEMCGIFNITFKQLPQFDLKNVVFGRVVRPSRVFECIREIGCPLNSIPAIEISATRRQIRKDGGEPKWRHGEPNTTMVPVTPKRFRVPKRISEFLSRSS